MASISQFTINLHPPSSFGHHCELAKPTVHNNLKLNSNQQTTTTKHHLPYCKSHLNFTRITSIVPLQQLKHITSHAHSSKSQPNTSSTAGPLLQTATNHRS
ncbi:hypothetical protein M0R45_018239 [Rubus argutus]|uniref:Uncharacterized protein n=1 Tax=Rubus argutus TaxID=59490 RepID=A0AAW1X1T6_RUBAR